MILGADKNLGDYIVEILSQRKDLGIDEMRRILHQMGKKYSIQALYKSIKKLKEDGVVVKNKSSYALRIPWVFDLNFLAQEMKRNYLESYPVNDILPNIGKKEIWKFTSLLRLNDFWSQILLILIRQSKNKILLGYNHHLWFHLVQTKQESQYLKSIEHANGKLYLIVGSRDYLDKWAEKFFDKKIVEYSYAKSQFEAGGPDYINIVDDFVLTVKVNSDTLKNIDDLYKQTKSFEKLDISKIIKIFDGNANVQIQLEKNPEKASKIKRKFANYFGVNF